MPSSVASIKTSFANFNFRFCGIVEFTVDVADIFRIEFYANRSIRIAQSSPIRSIIFKWIYWHCVVGSIMAVVSDCRSVCPRIIHHSSSTVSVFRSCFLTSSLIGTIGITLQIPLSMLFDVIFKGKSFSTMFYEGMMPMCASLIFVSILMKNDDSDPLLRLLKIAYRKICECRRPNVVR